MTQRIALVTGGMGGLGEAICMKLARMGIKVVVTYSPGNTKHAAWLKDMADRDYHFSAYPCDVADFDSCVKMVDQVTKEIGPIDILINNAGITRDGLLIRMKDEDWDRVMETNLRGAFLMTRATAKLMVRQRSGRIINIASTAGAMGSAGQANYSAAKAGLIGLTKASARELAHWGILVNAVAPGLIETDMAAAIPAEAREALLAQVPLKRIGSAREVAEMVGFLAGDGAAYVTGQVFHVNGGLYM
jgi:acetoacetyl-CoA reductase